ncbi:elongation factor P maturation arginine rhamnosyltransferase EarP [Stutzerimonas tarimensis]|uniref:Protein-arginine rhamnosyltransferase n=1 Tax=Stutzerimonas tarimensis TaxID=1507735 RepID=A0ABV7TA64_9GAMM
MSMKPTWDIFCAVVDNYGDIGVTWRLARQLAAEHDLPVRLWVDDLCTFAQLCPGASAAAAQQWHSGVEIRHWAPEWPGAEPADVVIEAFACELPQDYVQRMGTSGRRILWLNLEYLSAEEWVSGCHGLPSPQAGGLEKFFFFPGFSATTGGLIRERGLVAERRAFQADAAAQRCFLDSLGVSRLPDAQLISLFAYENAAVADWLDALASGAGLVQVLVPEGRVLPDVARWLGGSPLQPGSCHQRGALQLQVLRFMTQAQYDRLLWCCDFNAVRGEESFIRAQWAGRPLVWHIYPQEEAAHWDKLRAFFERYACSLDDASRSALWGFWQAWNAGEGAGKAWWEMRRHCDALRQLSERWTDEQVTNGDLAGKLVSFYADWL